MADYDVSLRNNAQTRVTQMFAKGELEVPNAFTYLNLLKVSESMSPSHNQVKDRIDRIADSYQFKREKRAIGTGAPSHDHTGVSGDTMIYTPVFSPVTDEFSLTLKQGLNNVFDRTEMLANEYGQSFLNLLEGQEEQSLDFVYNTRSQVDTSNYPIGTWNAVNSVYEIPLSQIATPNGTSLTTIKQVADSVMIGNNQKGRYIYFCDDVAFDKFMFGKNQGSSNNVNISFNEGNVTYVRSSGLNDPTRFGSVATYNQGVFVVMQEGTAGILDWISPINKQGKDDDIQVYSSIMNPLDGQMYALHMYSERVNGTAQNGEFQDELTEFQIWSEKAYVNSPLSTANKTTMKAFALTA